MIFQNEAGDGAPSAPAEITIANPPLAPDAVWANFSQQLPLMMNIYWDVAISTGKTTFRVIVCSYLTRVIW